MSQGHENFDHLEAPPKLQLPSWFVPATGAMIGIGALAFLIGLFGLHDPARAWKAYLIAFFFFTIIAVSGPFFVATQYLTRAGWSVTIRRIPESFTAFLVPAAALGLIYCLGAIGTVYEWPHVEFQDEIIKRKLAYLNPTGMTIRTLIEFAVWGGLGMWIVRNSLAQDTSGDPKLNKLNGRLAAIFIMLMSLMLTMFSVDFVMSLHPHWFSTMWTVNIWTTMFQAGISLTLVIVLLLHRQGTFKPFINENHIHDLGKMLFALTAFWAYITFSQFMLMWYANIPEEAIFWNARWDNGWKNFSLALIPLRFLLPFFLLLPRAVKRGKGLMPICLWILFMCVYEIWWWVIPAPSPGGHGDAAVEGAVHQGIHPELPWLEALVFIGFAGLFALVVGKTLARNNIIPIKDPKLHEALSHHQ